MKTKVVSGWVVKRETRVQKPGSQVVEIRRKQVSRVFHSRDAADAMAKLMKQHEPEADFYIAEKGKHDSAEIT